MNHSQRLLLSNLAWSSEATQRDPAYFDKLSQGQQPRVLWIGCSDSRVPAERITSCQPGELFVHRNIANLFCPDDTNGVSVLEYAVRVLQVEQIVVCGHTHCGGVRAALSPPSAELPAVNRRIAGLRELALRHRTELDRIADFDRRADRLAELNVIDQVRVLRRSLIVRQARQPLSVDGWIFELRDGQLKPLTDQAGQAAA
jgi:carbonic anhydrase